MHTTASRLRRVPSVRSPGVVLLVLLACAGCASVADLSARHKESGANSEFQYGDLTFPQYVSRMRDMVARTRLDLHDSRADSIVEANTPFELAPDASCPAGKLHRHAKGALLIHGLTDSPFQTRDVARALNSRCFLVRAILLPGHGTVPGDLRSVDYREWVKQTRWAMKGLSAEVDELYLVGFSTGGALCLHAVLAGQAVDGLVLFSPALRARSHFAFLSGLGTLVTPWLEVAPDDDHAKYESFTSNAAYQIYRLTKELETLRSAKLLAPMFVALSAEDGTTDSAETLAYFSKQSNPASKLILYASGKPKFDDHRIHVVSAARPEEWILEQSHISVNVAPENAHYGRRGDYRNCKHYLYDAEAWHTCKTASPIAQGERGIKKPDGVIFTRLTYNPDFAQLMQELADFLEQAEPISPNLQRP